MKPTVGLPTVADAGCAFGADLDSPLCGQPPTVHLLVASEAWGLVALDSCDAHAAVGRASGELINEHPYCAGCGSCPGCPSGECFG